MKTASFFCYDGPGRISIARFPPRRTPPGFRVYRALAPGPWFNSVERPKYELLYANQLRVLQPAQVWTDLHELAGEHEPILLCWERPQDLISGKTFCHRRLVAEYFHQALGHVVAEHDHPSCP